MRRLGRRRGELGRRLTIAQTVIACDLGTGSAKAALYRPDGACVAESVVAYPTAYPAPSWHEQRPADWWRSVEQSIRNLVSQPGVESADVAAIGVSGHSLGCVPMAADGSVLQETVPIWSDGRAEREASEFFERIPSDEWYFTTGNGFPAPLYTLFKIMWLRRNRPEVFARTAQIVGTKDYVNFVLTGRIATDHSYASGSGAYDLAAGAYCERILAAAGLDRSLLPEPVRSTEIIGEVTREVAAQLGLPAGVKVVAGGVDNSCMALGARTFREGDIFSSMGSSSWLTVSSAVPLLDARVRSYAFAHVVPGMFISATSIFSSGTTIDWVRDTLFGDVVEEANRSGAEVHALLDGLAAQSPRGANGLLFVPTLGGGTSLEGGPSVRGALIGLDLLHARADILRAAFEGVALALRAALDELRRMTAVGGEIIMVGGGARSAFRRQIIADVFDMTVLKSGIDQQAAALGAAALAFVGTGLWKDFEPVLALHAAEHRVSPTPQAKDLYGVALKAFKAAAASQSELAGLLAVLREASAAP